MDPGLRVVGPIDTVILHKCLRLRLHFCDRFVITGGIRTSRTEERSEQLGHTVESWFNYPIHASGTSSRGAGYGILAVVTFWASLCYYSVIYCVFWTQKKLEHIPIITQHLQGRIVHDKF